MGVLPRRAALPDGLSCRNRLIPERVTETVPFGVR